MYQGMKMDCENFQDLELWCSPVVTEEFSMDATDANDTNTLDIENTTHTTKTQIDTNTWDKISVSVKTHDLDEVMAADTVYSPDPHTYAYTQIPGAGPLIWGKPQLDNTDTEISVDQQTYDITNMEIIYDNVISHPTPSESTNSCVQSPSYLDSNCNSPTDNCMQWGDVFTTLDTNTYYTSEQIDTTQTNHDTLHSLTYKNNDIAFPYGYSVKERDTHTDLELDKKEDFKETCHEEIEEIVDSFFLPTQNFVTSNDTIISEFILHEGAQKFSSAPVSAGKTARRDMGLTLNTALWQLDLETNKFQDVTVTTPDMLRTVELLEEDHKFNLIPCSDNNKNHNLPAIKYQDLSHPATLQVFDNYEDIQQPKLSPKFEQSYLVPSPASSEEYCRNKYRKRKLSEDSDDSYKPETERKQVRKYKKRNSVDKSSVTKSSEKFVKRRGRPPKRRESVISNYTTDDNTANMSTKDLMYREMRNKNNEASRKSRMIRKAKEEEMEVLAVELDTKNKRLRIEADTLEKLTKRMKEILMSIGN